MKTYTVCFLGRSTFDEDELVEKYPKFKSFSKKKKNETVYEFFYEVIGNNPRITDLEEYGDEVEVEDDGF